MKAPVRVHAPATENLRYDRAYCRFISHAAVARKLEDVTCQACLTKIANHGTPFRSW